MEKIANKKWKDILNKINNLDLDNSKIKKYKNILEYLKYKILIKLNNN